MTDKEKLEAIRAEIHRLVDVRGYDREMANDLFAFMDSIPNEPVSEGLEEAANNAVIALVPSFGQKNSDGSYVGAYRDCFKRKELLDLFIAGAKWQKAKDQSTIELAEDHAMLAGMEKMKDEMMKDAIDVTVHIDAGGYPYIPQMELYDYDKDVPLAKKGNKYKVIFIKEG